ncbi:MAG: hypothetical protein ACLUAR_16805 [Pilosibacter sp.]
MTGRMWNEKARTGSVPGREYCGELLVKGRRFFVPESSAEQGKHVRMLDREDNTARIPERTPDSNKGTYGKVPVMAGEPRTWREQLCLSARAAHRMGAGLS